MGRPVKPNNEFMRLSLLVPLYAERQIVYAKLRVPFKYAFDIARSGIESLGLLGSYSLTFGPIFTNIWVHIH